MDRYPVSDRNNLQIKVKECMFYSFNISWKKAYTYFADLYMYTENHWKYMQPSPSYSVCTLHVFESSDIQHQPDCVSWQMSPCKSSIFLSMFYSLSWASRIICISSVEFHAYYTDVEINRIDGKTCIYNTWPFHWQN